jgi:hypothetical protein
MTVDQAAVVLALLVQTLLLHLVAPVVLVTHLQSLAAQ